MVAKVNCGLKFQNGSPWDEFELAKWDSGKVLVGTSVSECIQVITTTLQIWNGVLSNTSACTSEALVYYSVSEVS